MRKAVVLLVALLGAAVAVIKRRKAEADAELWREATSDSSR